MGIIMRETDIQTEIRRALGRVPGLVLMRNNVGLDTGRRGRPVRYGLGKGSPDLVGVLTLAGERPVALAFAIEVKGARGRPSRDQLLWHNQARERGMPVFVCRSAGDAVSSVKGWIMTLCHDGRRVGSDTREFFGI